MVELKVLLFNTILSAPAGGPPNFYSISSVDSISSVVIVIKTKSKTLFLL